MRTKRFPAAATAAAAAGAVVLTVLGGCAAQQIKSLEPKLELRTAVRHLAEAERAGFTLELTGSADDLIAGLKVPAGEAGTVRTLFASSVTLAYDGDRALLAATIGDVTGTEVRVVDGTVYAKAPMAALARKLGGDFAVDRRQAVAEVPQLGTLFDGGWIAVDARKAAEGAYGVPADDLDARKTLAEVQTSASNLLAGAAVVRDPADARHLTVTSSTTKAYAEMKRLMGAVSGPLAEELRETPRDRPIVLDLWIEDGKLRAAEIDVLQFVDGAAGRAAIRLEVATGREISVPAGATRIDPAVLGTVGVTAGDGAAGAAEELGFTVQMRAGAGGGKPAKYLTAAIAELGLDAKIVRRGVVQVTVDGDVACLTVPDSVDGEPTVVARSC